MEQEPTRFNPYERGPKRLDLEPYRRLCEQVLARDRWTCQICGSRTNLHVHHIQFRSRGGADVEENLITLCFVCHRAVHERSCPQSQADN